MDSCSLITLCSLDNNNSSLTSFKSTTSDAELCRNPRLLNNPLEAVGLPSNPLEAVSSNPLEAVLSNPLQAVPSNPLDAVGLPRNPLEAVPRCRWLLMSEFIRGETNVECTSVEGGWGIPLPGEYT